MKMNKYKTACAAMLLCVCLVGLCDVAYAAEDYTTITVEATDDESGVYRYAIDSTEDTAWQASNIFYVLPGTLHTVYVKDAAGNITSNEVWAEGAEVSVGDEPNDPLEEEPVPEAADNVSEDPYTAGSGTGTVTDYTDDSSKEYYTITTKNGNNFYLIIDHRSSDNNVYFTKPVSELDLLTLAAEAGEIEESALEQTELEDIAVTVTAEETESNSSQGSSFLEYLPLILLVVVLCGGYYYFMVYKKKKAIREEYDEEAADMEQFIPIEDDEDAALFAYKGNKASTEEEGNDSFLDELYEDNEVPDMDEAYGEQEELYEDGIPDQDIIDGGQAADGGEAVYSQEDDYDMDIYEEEPEENDV
ncbi:MAG: DUF4366 domain-containing protein [Clostridiales bacterium]|nr:DUF4366 domain-containing protein [Clostridiales bacterium]